MTITIRTFKRYMGIEKCNEVEKSNYSLRSVLAQT
jgi:hypothetical protein